MIEPLRSLEAGMAIPFGGDRVVRVPAELSEAFSEGDRLVVVQDTGDLLHITSGVWSTARRAVDDAHEAFGRMGGIDQEAVTAFYRDFARRLADEAVFEPIAEANAADVEDARRRGRSVTRLELTDRMRKDMIEGLATWESFPPDDAAQDTINHSGWRVELRRAGLGVVGFVFEGRPNVFADATGVLRSGNTVVFRIGSDALGTARAIMTHALGPAIEAAGLPPGSVTLV
ncbi:MAG: glutamate-5-semialdehyde dehydrogenase, partial [Acidimicrobiia bacterium]